MPGENKRFDTPVSSKEIASAFFGCYDLDMRPISVGGGRRGKMATLCYIDGLVSGTAIAEEIIRPLTDGERFCGSASEPEIISRILGGVVYGYTAKRRDVTEEVINDMLNGFCALIFENEKSAVTFETRSPDKRGIDQPREEKVIKGSKDAFVEVMKTNTMQIRRKIKNPDLKIKKFTVGQKTMTDVVMVYIDGFTNEALVSEAARRIEALDVEGMLLTAAFEENMVDVPKSPFPQIITTERVDKFCLNLLEGRVGMIIDGVPIGYLVPATLSQFMKVPEDEATHFIIASALTLLRYVSAAIALLLPGFYVAVAMYHQEMLPAKLIQSIIDAKQSVPFPTAVEVIAMLVAFELIQEAGLRLPNPIGETVSIIGALIVGQSAVEAKVVSPVVVIVVALSGICGYTMPSSDFGAALRICRFVLVLAAIGAGMFGLAIASALLVYHLCTIDSFGVSYLSPFAGSGGRHVRRALFRTPMTVKLEREPELRPGQKDI